MSKLAKQLASLPPSQERIRRGPSNVCGPVYEADADDAAAIDEFRHRPGESWRSAQKKFDELLGVERPIPNDKFRYHWNQRCFCWPDDMRRA